MLCARTHFHAFHHTRSHFTTTRKFSDTLFLSHSLVLLSLQLCKHALFCFDQNAMLSGSFLLISRVTLSPSMPTWLSLGEWEREKEEKKSLEIVKFPLRINFSTANSQQIMCARHKKTNSCAWFACQKSLISHSVSENNIVCRRARSNGVRDQVVVSRRHKTHNFS